MKGREHLKQNVMWMIGLLFLVLILNDRTGFVRFFIVDHVGGGFVPILILSFGFFLLGSVFPDIDSNDEGSFIYHTHFPFPLLAKAVKGTLQIGFEIEHKEFLHTIVGIFLSSLVVVIYLSIPYYLLVNVFTSVEAIAVVVSTFFWVSFMFLGQLSHLVQDKGTDPDWEIQMS